MLAKEDNTGCDYNNKIFSENNKKLLSKLFKDKFDSKLLKVEKNTKKHLLMISQTLDLTKYTTSLSIAIEKQVQEKIKKSKNKYYTPNKKQKTSKKFFSIPKKTSMQKRKSNVNIIKKNINTTIQNKTKINYNNTISNKTTITKIQNKNMSKRAKSFSNLTLKNKVKYNNNLRRSSQISKRSNSSNNNLLNSQISHKSNTYIKNSKKIPSSNKNKTFIDNRLKKVTNFNKKIIKTDFFSNSKNETKNNILSFENSLQNVSLSLNNDSLLFSSLKDLNHFTKNISSHKNLNGLLNDVTYNIQNKLEYYHIQIIFTYLNLKDLLSLKNISKYFRNLFIIFIFTKFEKYKKYIFEKIKQLNITEAPSKQKLDINNLILSNGSIKACELLNDDNFLWGIFEDEFIPTNDILLVYKIFFQIINNPLSIIAKKTDKTTFWEKCKIFFLNENKGKIGELLANIVKNKKINVDSDNLYKIFDLTFEKFNIICPSYFTKKCGTTGIFVFVIKDILDFLGFSDNVDEKYINNAYLAYTQISENINNKINYLKKNNL